MKTIYIVTYYPEEAECFTIAACATKAWAVKAIRMHSQKPKSILMHCDQETGHYYIGDNSESFYTIEAFEVHEEKLPRPLDLTGMEWKEIQRRLLAPWLGRA